MRRWGFALGLVALMPTVSALAQEADEPGDDVPTFHGQVAVSPPSAEDGDATGFTTTLQLRDRHIAGETLAEALREAPGARAQRSGGVLAPAALSVRGGDGPQTEVLLGDLPILAATGGVVDLAGLAPWLFERAELHPAGAPTSLGVQPIGGVLRLVPAEGRADEVHASILAGSFGTWGVRGGVGVRRRGWGMRGLVGVLGTEGNFPYHDDGGTLLDPGDDRERTRQNSDATQATTLLHLRGDAMGAELEGVVLATSFVGGLAPLPSRFVERPLGRRRAQRLTGTASLRWVHDGTSVRVLGGVGVDERSVSDPLAQYALVPREVIDRFLVSTVRLHVDDVHLGPLGLSAYAGLRDEQLATENLRAGERSESRRGELSVGAEARWAATTDAGPLEVRLGGRLARAAVSLDDAASDGARVAESELLIPGARLSAAWQPVAGLALSASLALGSRPPSSLELFGDRLLLAGNVRLGPETALEGTLGARLRWRDDDASVEVDAQVFVKRTEGLIRYQRASATQFIPRNIAAARVIGIEARAAVRLGPLDARLTVTGLDPRDEATGTRLPLRSDFVGYARLGVHSEPWGESLDLALEGEAVSDSNADAAGYVVIRARARLSALLSVAVLAGRLRLDVRVHDLFDARGFDVMGLPLQGRSIELEAHARWP